MKRDKDEERRRSKPSVRSETITSPASFKYLITTGAAIAAAMDTLNHLLFSQMPRHPAHAGCLEVVISWLHASQAAQPLISRLHIKVKYKTQIPGRYRKIDR